MCDAGGRGERALNGVMGVGDGTHDTSDAGHFEELLVELEAEVTCDAIPSGQASVQILHENVV